MTKTELPQEVKTLIENAKAGGHSVYSLNIAGVKYYYRSITRAEFRDLQQKLTKDAEEVKKKFDALKKDIPEKDPRMEDINMQFEAEANILKEKGEERLVAVGLLYPAITQNTPAGIVPTISDQIMFGSGYGNEEEPEVL
jgi:hypothetical protein